MSHIPYYNSTGQPPATPNRPVPGTVNDPQIEDLKKRVEQLEYWMTRLISD
jgi:hypothetical protein